MLDGECVGLVGADEDCFCLAVPVADLHAREGGGPFGDDGGVQGLAGAAGVFECEGREGVVGDQGAVFVEDELAVDGWWCAEGCDGEFVEDFECASSGESEAVVVDEEGGAAVPRAEEGPGGFGPALFGQVPVEGLHGWRTETEPVCASQGVGERVGDLVVEDKFGWAGCSGGEEREGWGGWIESRGG